jgi:hypothetical protein
VTLTYTGETYSGDRWVRMVDAAYLVLLIAIVWAVIRRRRPWIRRVSAAGQQRLRLTAMVLAIAVGSLGGLVIAIQPPGQHGIYRWSGYAVGSTMVAGALLYAIGLGVWLDRTAFALRLSGWVLMAAALVVPSTLTLALPVVAAMLVTVANIPPGPRGPRRPTEPIMASPISRPPTPSARTWPADEEQRPVSKGQ